MDGVVEKALEQAGLASAAEVDAVAVTVSTVFHCGLEFPADAVDSFRRSKQSQLAVCPRAGAKLPIVGVMHPPLSACSTMLWVLRQADLAPERKVMFAAALIARYVLVKTNLFFVPLVDKAEGRGLLPTAFSFSKRLAQGRSHCVGIVSALEELNLGSRNPAACCLVLLSRRGGE